MNSRLFHHEIRVTFGDCDPAGIVFFPNFHRWFDAATWAMFQSVGLTRQKLEQVYGIFGSPIVRNEAEFIRPARDGDTLCIESIVTRWGRSSFTIEHLARRGDLDIARAAEVRVWARHDESGAIEAVPVPEDVKHILSPACTEKTAPQNG